MTFAQRCIATRLVVEQQCYAARSAPRRSPGQLTSPDIQGSCSEWQHALSARPRSTVQRASHSGERFAIAHPCSCTGLSPQFARSSTVPSIVLRPLVAGAHLPRPTCDGRRDLLECSPAGATRREPAEHAGSRQIMSPWIAVYTIRFSRFAVRSRRHVDGETTDPRARAPALTRCSAAGRERSRHRAPGPTPGAPARASRRRPAAPAVRTCRRTRVAPCRRRAGRPA